MATHSGDRFSGIAIAQRLYDPPMLCLINLSAFGCQSAFLQPTPFSLVPNQVDRIIERREQSITRSGDDALVQYPIPMLELHSGPRHVAPFQALLHGIQVVACG